MAQSEHKGSFRDLDVWKKACELVIQVYDLTATFPAEEKFELTKHMRKTVWSIPLNIAEGCARYHRNEFLHFLSVAAGSLAEMATFLVIVRRLNLGDPAQHTVCAASAAEIGRMLHGLIASIRSRR
jgi:four helix bundle protein